MRPIFAAAALLVLSLMWTAAQVPTWAQQPTRTVADGLYTDVQATRGASSYDAACARCHRSDLGGADGPALKEDRFNRMFAGKTLQALYERISTTMPRAAPASLPEGIYLDILAHLLRENGFPAGAKELSAEAIDGVAMLAARPKPLPPVGDFSFVEVSGCLAQRNDGGWTLESAGDPIAVTASQPPESAAPGRGEQVFELIDALAYAPERHRGHLLRVRGTLVRVPGRQRLTMSAFQTLAVTCR
jgi:mono/diheme cytochrome c family protein